jgi:hypothetical protein
MNLLSMCTFIWTFITRPLVHIHQKTKIASVKGPLMFTTWGEEGVTKIVLSTCINFEWSQVRRIETFEADLKRALTVFL